MSEANGILILDFGSQVTQLIARRLRELNVYSEVHHFGYPLEKIKAMKPAGIILSGGPFSVYEKGAPYRDVKEVLEVAPVLGICYGMQLLARDLGGTVSSAQHREYGRQNISWVKNFPGLGSTQSVWMSHGDVVTKLPPGFELWAETKDHPAAMRSERAWALQFHPEVTHTDNGSVILKEFVKWTKASTTWTSGHIIESLQSDVRKQVKDGDQVVCGLSGGVDSSVVAQLLTKTLGRDRVHCVFVDTGLLRKDEYTTVLHTYEKLGLNVKGVDASRTFLKELDGVSDPEKKRKTIGRVFIEVFEAEAKKLPSCEWLAQGTLYPDVIESVSTTGSSVTIKSHHNVGGLPERMKLKLIEPLRTLFKDEVRKIGLDLGLPKDLIGRHPFPGPGLAIRVIGAVSEEKLQTLKEADDIFIKALKEENYYDKIWQAFCVILPIQTVGVQGDGRTYANVLSLRAVTSTDGMTADWYPLPYEFLQRVSNQITNKVRGINRVVYDVTSKPPATIEWE